MGGTKLERFLPKNQHSQRKLLNFENWVNGQVSKMGFILEDKGGFQLLYLVMMELKSHMTC